MGARVCRTLVEAVSKKEAASCDLLIETTNPTPAGDNLSPPVVSRKVSRCGAELSFVVFISPARALLLAVDVGVSPLSQGHLYIRKTSTKPFENSAPP